MFEDFKEIIDIAIKNSIDRDAKLIIVGRISYAVERAELTLKEAEELENMLGDPKQWQEAFQMAIAGARDNDKYQLAS